MADPRIIISAVDQTQAAFQSVTRGLSGVQSAAAALGVTVSGVGMIALAKQAIDSADKLGDLRAVTNLTVEQLAGLSLAAQQSGTDLDGVAKSVSKLSENMGKDAEKFARVGITAKDPIEAFKQLADVFNAIEDPQARAAFGSAALGKSWMEVAPLLKEGGDRIGEMVDKGTLLAGNIGQMQERSDAFNDSLAVLEATMRGKVSGTVNDLLPLLQAMTDELIGASEIASSADIGFNPLTETLRALIVLGGNVSFVFKGVGTEIGGIAAQIAAFTTGDFKGAGAIGDAMKADAEQARAAFDAWEARMMSAGNTAVVESAKIKNAVGSNTGAVSEFIRGVAKPPQLSDYDKLIAKLNGGLVDATVAAQTAMGDYTKSQQDFLKLAGSPEWDKMTERERMRVAGLYEQTIAQELETDAVKKRIKAEEDALKSQQDYMAGIGQETASLLDKAKAAEAENAMIGMTAEQLALVTAARYDEQIAIKTAEVDRLKKIQGSEEEINAAQAQVAMIEQQIDALNRLKGAEILRPKLQAQADAWQSFTGDIRSSLTDALMQGFKDGNDFGDNFIETLRNTLKTAELKIAVEAVVNPVMAAVQSTFPSAVGGASGGVGGMPIPGVGSMIGNGISMLGSAVGSVGMSAFGTGMGLSAAEAAAASAAYSSAGMAATGSALSAGSMVATAMPYLAAALAVYSIFGGEGGPTAQNLGTTAANYDAAGNLVNATGSGWMDRNASSDAFVAGLQSQYAASIAALGGTASGTSFFYGSGQQSDGTGALRRIAGGAGSAYFNSGEIGADAGAVQLAASRAVFAALQGSELPGYLRSVFDGLTASTATQQQITDTLAFAQSLKSLREQMTETRTPIEIARASMADLSASLHTSAATYRQDFVAAIDAGLTPATLARWQQFGALIQQVTQLEAERIGTINAAYNAARSDLVSAYQSEIDAQQTLMDKMAGYVNALRSFRNSLTLGALSPLSPEARYAEAQRQFDDVQRRARLGDEQAIGELQNVSQAFLQASRDYNASGEQYATDFAAVQDALQQTESLAQRQAGIASQQVDLLRSQLTALGDINTSVLSLADALAAFASAQGAYGTAGLIRSDAGAVYDTASGNIHAINGQSFSLAQAQDWISGQLAAGDLMSIYNKADELGISLASIDQMRGWSAGTAEDWARQNGLRAFASGGDHLGGLRLVGERGPELEITGPSRIFSADQTRQIMSGGNNPQTNAELKAQTAELRALVRQNGAGMQAMIERLAAMEGRLAEAERNARLARAA